ncbi:hypothetical protein M1446_01520 [Candidatus Dependentiae bacterium]|nr:hypothetical protein [Candidatus Dependentiae bacterium]
MKLNILFLIICYFNFANSKIGCMDKSYHLDRSNGFDYKTYHYVKCSCPCNKYPKTDDYRCIQCRHFHEPSETIFITH